MYFHACSFDPHINPSRWRVLSILYMRKLRLWKIKNLRNATEQMIDFIQYQVKVIPKFMLCMLQLSFPEGRVGFVRDTGRGDWERFADTALGVNRNEDGYSFQFPLNIRSRGKQLCTNDQWFKSIVATTLSV